MSKDSETNNQDFISRRNNLWKFLHRQVIEAERLAEILRRTTDEMTKSDETPEEKFAEGLLAIQNFTRNIDYSQAVKLTARCAAAEQKMIGE
jgi:CRISPR/Cas system CSM-associated protein Csm2 small subunit